MTISRVDDDGGSLVTTAHTGTEQQASSTSTVPDASVVTVLERINSRIQQRLAQEAENPGASTVAHGASIPSHAASGH